MSLYRRNGWYYTDFSSNGQRFRQSLDTRDPREASRKEKELISLAQHGKLSATGHDFARLTFNEAADRYLASRKLELAPSTYKKDAQLLVKLRAFFGGVVLNRIRIEHVLAYRESRSHDGVGPAFLNMEIGCLRRILKRAKRWHLLAEDIKPLKEPRTIGRALTHEEKLKLLKKASEKPEWQTAYWAALIALNTTMRGCELEWLTWADVNLIDRTLMVRKSKTVAGERVIPLNPEAFDTLLKFRKRAELFGTVEPSHYVIGAFRPKWRFNGNDLVGMSLAGFNPNRPLGSWRTAWRKLVAEAGLPGLRFHDMRHQAITELAESGASDRTIMAIAGHVSTRMLERYSHVRLEAKRKALESLMPSVGRWPEAQKAKKPNVTKHVTKRAKVVSLPTEVIEKYGRPERTRTVDLYRVKVAL
jgi:integrase